MAFLSAVSGLLIGIVGSRKGCAGGGAMVLLRARTGKLFERLAALSNEWPLGGDPGGMAQDEHESLILAQNERWRHA